EPNGADWRTYPGEPITRDEYRRRVEAVIWDMYLALLQVVGPRPFRPVPVDRRWLAWDGGRGRRLADAAYGTRPTLGPLAPEALLVLADALEEAGCDHPELVDHLRHPRPHVAGCWAVDLPAGRDFLPYQVLC